MGRKRTSPGRDGMPPALPNIYIVPPATLPQADISWLNFAQNTRNPCHVKVAGDSCVASAFGKVIAGLLYRRELE